MGTTPDRHTGDLAAHTAGGRRPDCPAVGNRAYSDAHVRLTELWPVLTPDC